LTSNQLIQLCEEKNRKKQEEEDEKARKKREREEKAKQIKSEAEEKAKLRWQNQEERARKKAEEEKKKEERQCQMERKQQSQQQKKIVQINSDGSAPSTSSVPEEMNELIPQKAKHCKTTAIPCCALYSTPEGSSYAEDVWIKCSNCDRCYEKHVKKMI